jgi:phosphoribosyl 1,2-cyclic phosphate phosphodiesterase
MIVTFLGTGTSYGVPFVGCDCEVCRSSDPHNKRLRASITVEVAQEDGSLFRVLVDTGPDLRAQLLREGISRIDAVLWTHTHNDHIIGLDDLRPVTNVCGYVPGYGSREVIGQLHNIFDYALTPGRVEPFFPRITPHVLEPYEAVTLGGMSVRALTIKHGQRDIFAYRFEAGGKAFVYATDCSGIPEESWPFFEGLDLLAIDALRPREHPTHFSVGQSLSVAARVRPTRTLFTHMAHDLDHAPANAELPQGVALAFDGQRVVV